MKVRLKPISPFQLQALGKNRQELTSLIRQGQDNGLQTHNRLPFRLGLIKKRKVGLAVLPTYPFAQLDTLCLSERKFSNLLARGHTYYRFPANNCQLMITLSCSRPFSYSMDGKISSTAVFDAIDYEQGELVGTYGVELNLTLGIMEGKLVVNPAYARSTAKRLRGFGWNPRYFYYRRYELTKAPPGPLGSQYYNLSVVPEYRNKGKKGYFGIAQLLLTTGIRFAAEQFLLKAYLMSAAYEKLVENYGELLGAVEPELDFPNTFNNIIVSFCGDSGFQQAKAVIEKRHREAMSDWD